MERKMYYDSAISGHHMEFNLNILREAQKREDNNIFIFGTDFCELAKEKFGVDVDEKYNDLSIFFIPKWFNNLLQTKLPILLSLLNIVLLKYYIKRFKVDKVILLNMNVFLRFIPLFFFKTRLSGILFKQQSFIQNNRKLYMAWINHIVKKNNVEDIYVLNDKNSVDQLNSKFSTDKLKFLPDPIEPMALENIELIATNENTIVLLFLGVLKSGKGITEVLQALRNVRLPNSIKIELRFIGKVIEDYYEDFYDLVNSDSFRSRDDIHIVVKNDFVEKHHFLSELLNADYLMLTYKDGFASSGVLGYSMMYNKNIIGSNKGFIGDVLWAYDNGTSIDLDFKELIDFFENFNFRKKSNICFNKEYAKEHSFKMFYNILNESLI